MIINILTIINIYAPNSKDPKIHEENVDRIERKNRQFYNNSERLPYHPLNDGCNIYREVSKEIEILTNTINQLNYIYKTLYPRIEEYTFLRTIWKKEE